MSATDLFNLKINNTLNYAIPWPVYRATRHQENTRNRDARQGGMCKEKSDISCTFRHAGAS